MKIASQKTFQDFDRLKDQIFAHKRQKSIVEPTPPKIGYRWKIIFPLFLISSGLWLIYRNRPNYIQYLREKNLAWKAVQIHFHKKLQQTTGLISSKNLNFANKCYLTMLQSDLLYLSERVAIKKLMVQKKSNFSLWVIGWNNQETIKYINQYGDLMQTEISSKLIISDLLRIWQNRHQRLLKRNKVFQCYVQNLNEIGHNCQKVNIITKFQANKDEYNKIIEQCRNQSQIISMKIKKKIEQRLLQQKNSKIFYQ